jgi:hypothetical protein
MTGNRIVQIAFSLLLSLFLVFCPVLLAVQDAFLRTRILLRSGRGLFQIRILQPSLFTLPSVSHRGPPLV